MSISNKLSVSDGYHFYKNVLKSPKFVLAPLVSQSELAWRMLARKHGAQLCYTPMCSVNCFLNNKIYRQEVLKDISCSKDRPLIVQFCTNSAEKFVAAASMVEKYCDGVDLNLGCPQLIAKRGHFGAYMQEDWDLIHDIVSEARKHLKIGVTAKIRVFPEISKTVEYAQMLESAGCQLLAVHGRTRVQKKEMTGLASWSHIKAVKNALSIPVLANGNIQYFEDIEHCLEETGVDGVMVAEGHLSNPYIFEGLQPSVFDVIDEYLSIVEEYPAPMSYIRTHTFNLLSHTFQRHKSMMNMLANTTMIKILVTVCERLKILSEQDELENSIVKSSGLPYWICQPYNKYEERRLILEEKVKNNPKLDELGLTKHQAKQIKKLEYSLRYRRRKRLEEHKRKKERDKETNRILAMENGILKSRVLRNIEKKQSISDRMEAAMQDDKNNLVVCLDLTWNDIMNEKEINKLANQLGRLYGSNRNAKNPAHLYFSGLDHGSLLWEECLRKHDGFEEYKIDVTSQPFHELFAASDIVYLTPDSPTALETVDPGIVYVLGGLVDETVKKKLSLERANERNITTRRLPVEEYMCRSGKHSNYSKVFCINQVFDILLTYYATRDWKRALTAGVPPRKGYVLNEEQPLLKSSATS